MSKHLLYLSDLNAAAPGVLSVVFGLDGAFGEAPTFSGPVIARDRVWSVAGFNATDEHLWGVLLNSADGAWPPDYESMVLAWCALDLRIPTVAARLLHLLRRLNVQSRSTRAAIRASTNRYLSGTWTESDAADLGVVVLALAPQIAALS